MTPTAGPTGDGQAPVAQVDVGEGRRLTAQALQRREPERRYPILLTLLAQSSTEVLDEVVQLFDQAVSARESKVERKMRDELAERGSPRRCWMPCGSLAAPPRPGCWRRWRSCAS